MNIKTISLASVLLLGVSFSDGYAIDSQTTDGGEIFRELVGKSYEQALLERGTPFRVYDVVLKTLRQDPSLITETQKHALQGYLEDQRPHTYKNKAVKKLADKVLGKIGNLEVTGQPSGRSGSSVEGASLSAEDDRSSGLGDDLTLSSEDDDTLMDPKKSLGDRMDALRQADYYSRNGKYDHDDMQNPVSKCVPTPARGGGESEIHYTPNQKPTSYKGRDISALRRFNDEE